MAEQLSTHNPEKKKALTLGDGKLWDVNPAKNVGNDVVALGLLAQHKYFHESERLSQKRVHPARHGDENRLAD